MLRATCGFETEESHTTEEENLITQQNIDYGISSINTEDLVLNKLEQPDDNNPTEKMMKRNLRSAVCQENNEKTKSDFYQFIHHKRGR